MNIFKLSDKEFEKYLKEDIDNKNPEELLLELIECGLEIGVDNNEEDDCFLI